MAVLQIRIVTRLLSKVATNECSALLTAGEFTPCACWLNPEDVLDFTVEYDATPQLILCV